MKMMMAVEMSMIEEAVEIVAVVEMMVAMLMVVVEVIVEEVGVVMAVIPLVATVVVAVAAVIKIEHELGNLLRLDLFLRSLGERSSYLLAHFLVV